MLHHTMENGFKFKLLWNDADVLKVRISASNGNFGGTADVYVPVGGLAEAAEKLAGFPQSTSDERELVFGEFGPAFAGGALKMRFYCKGSAGHALLESWLESDHIAEEPAESAHFLIPLEASAIDEFVSELRSLETNLSGIARLNAVVCK